MNFKTILYPTDYSEPSGIALAYAVALAHAQAARLVVLHAVETLGPENVTYGEIASRPQPDGYRQRLWNDLHQVRPSLPDVHMEYLLSEADPAEAILRIAEKSQCDLIVMGSHGRGGLKCWLMGSVAEKVVRRARCPVLVVKAPLPASPFTIEDPTELHPNYLSEHP